MRVLITGSSGQIGTNLGHQLQEQGHYVFGVDIWPNTWTSESIPKAVEWCLDWWVKSFVENI